MFPGEILQFNVDLGIRETVFGTRLQQRTWLGVNVNEEKD